MTRLVLINGAPGSGKSTLALALAQEAAMTLALDIDGLKYSLGRWDRDPSAAGLHARRLALAVVREHVRSQFDVVIGQYLARTQFIEDLERLARLHDARFHEFVLDVDAGTLAKRLGERMDDPSRPEHAVNNRLVGPEDATALLQSLEPLRESRRHASWVDATGSPAQTLDILRAELRRDA